MGEANRWWPVESEAQLWHGTQMLIANLLGPKLNRELASVLADTAKSGVELSEELQSLQRTLSETDGQAPVMLVHLVHAVLISTYLSAKEVGLNLEPSEETCVALKGEVEVGKVLGSVAKLAAEKYGFTTDTWILFAKTTLFGGQPEWPPRGVAYRQFP